MAKNQNPYDSMVNYRTTRELENVIIWSIVILLTAIVVQDTTLYISKLLPLMIAGAAGSLLINSK